ncbi:hypothetical protein [Kribbella sp. NPDC051770]|uniref:hypothetical protein n=1 Tax=Kribbella sp. NPDC051770 TaxID=3155413 RepID=UPI0034321381
MSPTRNRTRLAAVLTRRRPAAPKQEAANCPGGETRPAPAVAEPVEVSRPSYSLIGW